MHRTIALVALATVFLLTSCEDVPSIRVDLLTNDWLHSFEEDSPHSTAATYRPSDSRPFDPSRFRMEYMFRENGDCLWMELMPTDAHVLREGRWWLSSFDESILFVDKGARIDSFRILELGGDILRLEAAK